MQSSIMNKARVVYMKITDFEKKDFGGCEGLPKGDTIVNFTTLEIDPTEIEYDGEKKLRYLLTLENGETYYAPKTVMADLKQLEMDGFPQARITRNGEKLETKYTVVGLK